MGMKKQKGESEERAKNKVIEIENNLKLFIFLKPQNFSIHQ